MRNVTITNTICSVLVRQARNVVTVTRDVVTAVRGYALAMRHAHAAGLHEWSGFKRPGKWAVAAMAPVDRSTDRVVRVRRHSRQSWARAAWVQMS